jgi:hypothetical protein
MSWAPDPILGGSTRTDGVSYKLSLHAMGKGYTWMWRVSWLDPHIEAVWLDPVWFNPATASVEGLVVPEEIERYIDIHWPEAVAISSVSGGVTTHTAPLDLEDWSRPRITLTKAQATLLACGATIILPDGTQLNVEQT